MSEIEKLYENAGIYPDCRARECGLDYCPNNYGCGYAFYPDFTAEKQLKIIEWFISCRWWLNLKSLDKKIDFSLSFDKKLAKLVNRLWESFSDQEKEEIRGILNENS